MDNINKQPAVYFRVSSPDMRVLFFMAINIDNWRKRVISGNNTLTWQRNRPAHLAKSCNSLTIIIAVNIIFIVFHHRFSNFYCHYYFFPDSVTYVFTNDIIDVNIIRFIICIMIISILIL